MAVSLTRREQWALIGVVTLIAAGLSIQAWRANRSEGSVVYVPGQGRWEKLADFEAGQRPQPPAAIINGGAKNPNAPTSASLNASPQAPGTQSTNDPGGLDINRATADEFDRLPGLGPAKARAILETRAKLGGFTSIDQLDNVPGIGAKTLERLRPYLKLAAPPARSSAPTPTTATTHTPSPATTGNPAVVKNPAALNSALTSPPPAGAPLPSPKSKAKAAAPPAPQAPLPVVDVNAAPAEELEKITGVGPVLARRIVEERAAHGPFRSPRDLTRVKGIGPRNLLKMLPQVVTGPAREARTR